MPGREVCPVLGPGVDACPGGGPGDLVFFFVLAFFSLPRRWPSSWPRTVPSSCAWPRSRPSANLVRFFLSFSLFLFSFPLFLRGAAAGRAARGNFFLSAMLPCGWVAQEVAQECGEAWPSRWPSRRGGQDLTTKVKRSAQEWPSSRHVVCPVGGPGELQGLQGTQCAKRQRPGVRAAQ